MALIRTNLNENFREICQASLALPKTKHTRWMLVRKGASSQESLNDKNDICLRGLFKIPPLTSRPAGGTHTFSAAILPMPVSPP
jgi:hypothetical protein